MPLIFVSVWFYSSTKHISCLYLPWLCIEKLLRMGSGSWGAECSGHGTSRGCNNLKEGAEWVPAQGWGSGVHREEMYPRRAPVPGETLWAATGQFWHRAGEGSERLTLSSACLACHSPDFQWDTQKLSPSVPRRWLSIHLHTTQPQGGFTLDSEVKAVGHF